MGLRFRWGPGSLVLRLMGPLPLSVRAGAQQLMARCISPAVRRGELCFLVHIKIRNQGPLPKANTFNLSHRLPVIHRMEFTMVFTLPCKSGKWIFLTGNRNPLWIHLNCPGGVSDGFCPPQRPLGEDSLPRGEGDTAVGSLVRLCGPTSLGPAQQ